MKPISFRTAALAAPLLGISLAYGCAPDDPTVEGGMAGSAGTPSTAGTPGAAGTAPTTAGAPSTAGSTSGGAPSTAGSTSTAGAGGSTAGTGGAGTAGSGGSGGASEPVTIDAILSEKSSYGNPGWKDSWWVTGCTSKHDHDCYTMEACPASGSRTKESFPIKGKPGQNYKVSFRYAAVNEGRAYEGGTKDKPVAADLDNIDNNDSFHRDGTANISNYNELRMTVYDDKGAEARHYFMNSFSKAQEAHVAFLSSYKKTIVIVGGGKIEHMVFDSNCHAIDNCNAGTVGGTTCNSPRRIPGPDGQLMLPEFYENPNDGGKIGATSLISITASRMQPWKSQASHLVVTAIEETSDPVTTNYPDPQ